MSELRQQTIDTYNNSAQELADYFRGIGPRTEDIDLAFQLAGNPANSRVLEIGCGDGRDAKGIVDKTDWYMGIDISEELIKLAEAHVPGATFQVADAANFDYPKDLDVVFAFASLLHLDKEEVTSVLKRIHESLKPGGIFYISLKEKSEYGEEIKSDQYGTRLFYFYNANLITDLAGDNYQPVAESRHTIGNTDWFEIALKNS